MSVIASQTINNSWGEIQSKRSSNVMRSLFQTSFKVVISFIFSDEVLTSLRDVYTG